jgi:hypothetical protein
MVTASGVAFVAGVGKGIGIFSIVRIVRIVRTVVIVVVLVGSLGASMLSDGKCAGLGGMTD